MYDISLNYSGDHEIIKHGAFGNHALFGIHISQKQYEGIHRPMEAALIGKQLICEKLYYIN